jgi:5,10-methylenetetrahydromethanopterin reductase
VTALPRLAVRLHGGMPAADCVAQAMAAEAAGFASVWFAENPFARGILPAATACAVATRRIAIGAGVFNPFNRHPSLIAQEIGALDELAQGRVRLGIGSGVGSAIERIGLNYARPLTAVADAIAIVRALLAGGEVSYRGKLFSVDRIELDFAARSDIAILMAGRGDASLKLVGEIADGLILSNMCAPRFVARAAEKVAAAAAAAGRARRPEVVRYVPCCIAADRRAASRAARHAIGQMLPNYWALAARLPAARAALLDSGIAAEEFAAAAERLRAGEDADTVLDERFVAAFAIAGTPVDCCAQIRTAGASGVTELALSFAATDVATMHALAAAIGASA